MNELRIKVGPAPVTFSGGRVRLAKFDLNWMAKVGFVAGMAFGAGSFGTLWSRGLAVLLAFVAGLDAYWQVQRQKPLG